MAEEIIDIRERIEKMRIQIEKETLIEKINQKPMKTLHKMSNSNISLSLQDKVNEPNNIEDDHENIDENEYFHSKFKFIQPNYYSHYQ